MWIGIWAPSNEAGTWYRAFVPFVPRPAVLPLDPSPRPTRVFLVCEPGAGRRWCTLSVIELLHFLDRDQVGHGLDHAADLRPVFLDDHVVDPLEAQRAQRLPLILLVADPGTGLRDLQTTHRLLPALRASAHRVVRSRSLFAVSAAGGPAMLTHLARLTRCPRPQHAGRGHVLERQATTSR